MNPSDWQAEGHWLVFRPQTAKRSYDLRIFYRISVALTLFGQHKPVLLLIHGFPTSSWDWHRVWGSLAQHYDLIAADMLGFGCSDKPRDFPYSIALQADMQQALMQHLAVQRCDVLAHDYGDTVAQELMARQLDGSEHRLRTVTLLNGGLFAEAHRPLMVQRLLASPIGRWLALGLNEKKLRKNLQRICRQPLSDDDIAACWRFIQLHQGTKVIPKLLSYMGERKRHRQRWVSALIDWAEPLHLINGLADPISGQHMVDRYRQVVAKEPVTELSDVGHYPQLEAPNEVIGAVLGPVNAI